MISRTALYVPKQGSDQAEYEDAFAFDAGSSLAAVADGAGSAFESRRWARLLTEAFVGNPPFGLGADQMLDWVGQVSARWFDDIPWSTLDYFESTKADEGSAATLVGLRLGDAVAGTGRWECLAIGDSCMFQVRADHCIAGMPISSSAQFGKHPPLLYTRRATTEKFIDKLVYCAGEWRPGDSFFILTDAMSEWFLQRDEQGARPWNTLTSLDQHSFENFATGERRNRQIQNDDLTVVILRTDTASVPRQAHEPPVMPPIFEEEPVRAGSGAGGGAGSGVGGARGIAPLGGGTGPRPSAPARRDRDRTRPADHRGKTSPAGVRSRPAVVLAGVLMASVLLGVLIGKITSGGGVAPALAPSSASAPVSSATSTPATFPGTAIETVARLFGTALVTYDGSYDDYRTALGPYITDNLYSSLPVDLHFTESAFAQTTSQGSVASVSLVDVTDNAAQADVLVYRVATVDGVALTGQYVPVELSLVRSQVGTWLVTSVAPLPASDQLIPQPTPKKSKNSTTHPAGTAPAGGPK